MKKLVSFLVGITVLASGGFSQQGNAFKSTDKKQPGSASRSMAYTKIQAATNLKSALIHPSFPLSKNIPSPDLKYHDQVKKLITDKGSPIYIEREKSSLKSANLVPFEEQFYSFFEETKTLTGINNPREDLKITHVITDEFGITHIRARQLFKGLEIYGAESYLHSDKHKDVFTGRILIQNSDVSIKPQITKEIALKKVKDDVRVKTIFKELSDQERSFMDYDSPEAKLLIYEGKLAYQVSIRPNFIEEWRYFVNADNGEILFSFNNTNYDGPVTANALDLNGATRTISTYLDNGKYVLVNASESMYNSASGEGIIMTLDANNTSTVDLDYDLITSLNNTWNNPAAVSAHYHATITYKYLKSTFNRNSLNNMGGNIISFINVTEDDGSSMENAFWNGKAVFYGNGGDAFKPLAGALDVAAHELGHGVVSNTANLEYYGQSGAINETYADIFGSMVDREDWYIGEDITKTSFSPSGRLRDMSDPHNGGSSLDDPYWQPKHVSEMYTGSQDNGGVHINNGIGIHAYYLYATATSKEIAEQVFYKALTNYLTTKSQFIDFRLAVVQAAKDIHGDNSAEVIAAGNAFDAVGIYEEEQVDPAQDYDENPGQDYLLFYNTYYPDEYGTLYRSTMDGGTFDLLSVSVLKRVPSVSDDGSYALFVSDDSYIRGIYTDPDYPDESVISYDAWDNVAVSKDGNRVAAISTVIDTAIYVYDYISEKWGKFILYNPTTSHTGTDAGGVIFADAIEFDHTGEYLIYDAFNVLYSSSGDDISYWDIGFIKVWDNASGNFGDGTIQKLYGSLPENVSIGNPTFSKNSPYIIAFDYLNSSTNEFGIFGHNILTGDLDLITGNTTIGYPSFSGDDSRIAFTALDDYGYDVVGVVDLDENKITGAGNASILISDAKWAVYYTEGERSLGLAPVANFTVDVKSGNAPLSVQFIDLSVNRPTSWYWTFPGGTPSTSNIQNPAVTYHAPGTYQVSLTCSNSTGNNTVTKTGYISVSENTGIEAPVSDLVNIYPNPTHGILFIDSDMDFSIKIFSLMGNVLMNVKNQRRIDLTGIPSGLYILQLEMDGRRITEKIIKQ
jgi:Zn-dependent metalloprotease